MKKYKLILILLFAAIFLSGCSLMTNKNTFIQIYNCEHGSIELQLTGENTSGSDFLLMVYPHIGYKLKFENLFVYNDNHEGPRGYALYSPLDRFRILPTLTSNENVYILKADKESKLVINALFTKIE